MDITLTHAKNKLAAELTELGRRLDAARDPKEMGRLVAQRKRLHHAMTLLRNVTPVRSHGDPDHDND